MRVTESGPLAPSAAGARAVGRLAGARDLRAGSGDGCGLRGHDHRAPSTLAVVDAHSAEHARDQPLPKDLGELIPRARVDLDRLAARLSADVLVERRDLVKVAGCCGVERASDLGVPGHGVPADQVEGSVLSRNHCELDGHEASRWECAGLVAGTVGSIAATCGNRHAKVF